MFKVPPERRVLGFHVDPPEPPGFRMNADGSVGKARSSGPGFSDHPRHAGPLLLAKLAGSPPESLVPEPPFLRAVPAEPSPPATPAPDWPEKANRLAPPLEFERVYWLQKGNRLGIPEDLMRDPDWRPAEWHSDQIRMDPHGRILPWSRPWPAQLPGR